MKLTLLGHSCFAVESGGYRVVLDPYYVESYPPLHTSANEVLCSHHHRDHDFVEAVELTPRGGSPFTVETVPSLPRRSGRRAARDEHHPCPRCRGAARRASRRPRPRAEREQLAPLRGCDTLLIPVGGFYTIDAETAKRVADAIAPRVIVPMHYRHGSHGYDVIATVEDFLRLYPADEVHCLDGSSFELTPDAPRGVIVPKFMG